jgi:hypothetical protein
MRTARMLFASSKLVASLAVLIAWALLQGQALAQPQPQYKEIPPDPDIKTWTMVKNPPTGQASRKNAIEEMLRGTASYDEDLFKTFFNKVVFPQFTLRENIYYTKTVNKLKNTVCVLPDMRREFRQEFMGREHSNRQARDRLNDLTLKAMSHIANDNYHPLARYNAMLLIADLTEDSATDKPYRLALLELGNAISESDDAKKVRKAPMIDAVRVAGLVGIQHHAAAGLDAKSGPWVAARLMPIVTAKTPPSGRTRQGHDWMRRQALDALAAINARNQTQDASFTQLLDSILQEEDATLELRAAAVESLLSVKITPPPSFDPARMAAGIARIAVDAYHHELEASDQYGRAVVLEPGLKYYGTLAQRGLAALAAVAQSPKIDELNTKVANLLDLSPEDHEPYEIYDLVASNGADLEAAVTGKAVTDILPERAPVNPVPAGGGYTAPGRGYNPDAGPGYRPQNMPRYGGQSPGYPGQPRYQGQPHYPGQGGFQGRR